MSNEAFAEHLGIAVRTIAGWHQKPDLRPKSEMQQLLDTAFEQASTSVKERFTALAAGGSGSAGGRNRFDGSADAPVVQLRDVHGDVIIGSRQASPQQTEAGQRLSSDRNIGAALEWLDRNAQWEPGTARRKAAERLVRLDLRDLQDRGSRRGGVDQRRIAQALGEYYGHAHGEHGTYTARYGDSDIATTSILTRPDWLDLDCPLVVAHDRLAVASGSADAHLSLDEEAAERAVQRLAETLLMGVRLIDMPLYRLLGVDLGKGAIGGSLGITRFAEYAVTMDLLEGELIDALAQGTFSGPGALSLRDRYLPDLESVLNLPDRLCAGGPLALCAIARPANPFRGGADYLLLVQERSGHVLNAARRLAVIPKGFHQPMTDYRADAQIGATLRREMEEELFGRDDIDNTVAENRTADPMHPSRLSEPMRWLIEGGLDRVRMECTGFGLNLVSGNFEFPGLIVIDDEEFWSRYGGVVEANWEASGLRQYSSLDRDLMGDLIGDVAWSNEGLFALLQGLRRLEQIGGDRVNLPPIEWEVGE
jgi:hypothetical protein